MLYHWLQRKVCVLSSACMLESECSVCLCLGRMEAEWLYLPLLLSTSFVETEFTHWILAGQESPRSACHCHSLAPVLQVCTGTLSFSRGSESGLHANVAALYPWSHFPTPTPDFWEHQYTKNCRGKGFAQGIDWQDNFVAWSRVWFLGCLQQRHLRTGQSPILLLTRSVYVVIICWKQFDTSQFML